MGKFLADAVLDATLDEIATATRQALCSAEPSTFGEIAGLTLAEAVLDSGDFTVADGDVSGRKLTVAAQPDVEVENTGEGDHLVLHDGSEIKAVTTCDPLPVTDGGVVTFPAWKYEIGDPPESGAVEPILDIDFTSYATLADVEAEPWFSQVSGDDPTTDATLGLVCTYDGGLNTSTSGIDVIIGDAGDDIREYWEEIVVQYPDGWADPDNSVGMDDKALFALEDNNPAGSNRSELKPGIFANRIDALWGNFALQGFTGDDLVLETLWDGDPHTWRRHLRMGDGDGIYRWWQDGTLYIDEQAIDSNPDAGAYFARIALGRNANPPVSSPRRCWLSLKVYISDPGWGS